MRNVAADTLLLEQLCGMSQLFSDWGHERFRVLQLGVCDLCSCRRILLERSRNPYVAQLKLAGYVSCLFDHPHYPWYPEAINSWRKALAAVNTDQSNFLFRKFDSDMCYTSPERVSTTSPGKDKAMIDSWVK